MIKNQKQASAAVRITEWVGTGESVLMHTIVFAGSFALILFGVARDTIFLALTTVVSLEAIYLSIFIQMTVNRNTKSLEEVEEDIGEIQEDVKEIESDVEEISEDVGEISEDVEELSEDLDKIQERDEEEVIVETKTHAALGKIEQDLQRLLADIEALKRTQER